MEEGRWPKVVFNDILCKKKKTWMRQNIKWLSKWDMCMKIKIKVFVLNKFHKRTWDKEPGRKKKYYIEEFNPTYNQHQKAYIGANIPWKAKILIAQLRTNSHQLCCETWRKGQKKPRKKECIFCKAGKVETKNISF